MATVTPRQIYQALLDAGATEIEAIGIMANGLAESTLNPEAVGDNGTSFGIWQEHGTQYAGLVTGNPSADMNAQVRILALNKGFAAASGSTASEAAGNFSANYERCTTCQKGQASYSQRVANAAVVAGWVQSGKWPTSAPQSASGSSGSGGSGGGGSGSAATGSSCLISFPGVKIPVAGSVGGFCILPKSEARALIGGGLIVMAAGIGLVGAIILAAAAFNRTGALSKAAQAASVVPGGGAVAAPLRRAHARVSGS